MNIKQNNPDLWISKHFLELGSPIWTATLDFFKLQCWKLRAHDHLPQAIFIHNCHTSQSLQPMKANEWYYFTISCLITVQGGIVVYGWENAKKINNSTGRIISVQQFISTIYRCRKVIYKNFELYSTIWYYMNMCGDTESRGHCTCS